MIYDEDKFNIINKQKENETAMTTFDHKYLQ